MFLAKTMRSYWLERCIFHELFRNMIQMYETILAIHSQGEYYTVILYSSRNNSHS